MTMVPLLRLSLPECALLGSNILAARRQRRKRWLRHPRRPQTPNTPQDTSSFVNSSRYSPSDR